jgi:hypothetical protein
MAIGLQGGKKPDPLNPDQAKEDVTNLSKQKPVEQKKPESPAKQQMRRAASEQVQKDALKAIEKATDLSSRIASEELSEKNLDKVDVIVNAEITEEQEQQKFEAKERSVNGSLTGGLDAKNIDRNKRGEKLGTAVKAKQEERKEKEEAKDASAESHQLSFEEQMEKNQDKQLKVQVESGVEVNSQKLEVVSEPIVETTRGKTDSSENKKPEQSEQIVAKDTNSTVSAKVTPVNIPEVIPATNGVSSSVSAVDPVKPEVLDVDRALQESLLFQQTTIQMQYHKERRKYRSLFAVVDARLIMEILLENDVILAAYLTVAEVWEHVPSHGQFPSIAPLQKAVNYLLEQIQDPTEEQKNAFTGY